MNEVTPLMTVNALLLIESSEAGRVMLFTREQRMNAS